MNFCFLLGILAQPLFGLWLDCANLTNIDNNRRNHNGNSSIDNDAATVVNNDDDLCARITMTPFHFTQMRHRAFSELVAIINRFIYFIFIIVQFELIFSIRNAKHGRQLSVGLCLN